MLVKCIDTKEKMDRKEAYCLNVNGKNRYYSSKEGYEKYINNNFYRNKCIDTIRDIMGYVLPQMKLPTLTYKLVEEFKEPIGYDVLYNTLLAQKKAIEWAFYNKDFGSEIARVQYLFAIVQNHYMEEYRKKATLQRMAAQEKNEAEDPNEMVEGERRQAVKDLSNFLNDD